MLRAGQAAFAILFGAVLTAEQAAPSFDLAATLQRAGERVEYYFARAQSIVCFETVSLQPLSLGLSGDGPARTVQSELRLSWDPTADTRTPLEAKTLRQVLKVNGHAPRKNDYDNCTSPEQNDTETQPLSMLLPQQRVDYTFSIVGPAKQDGRAAILVAYRMKAKPTVTVSLVDNNENCISYSIDGGMRGRIWIDAETYDVLRLDQGLGGLVDIKLPWQVARRSPDNGVWTMERFDSSIRFKPIKFSDPDETLILPVSASSLRITRRSGSPRLRTNTEYTQYRRFLTAGRVVPQ
ncbi:MAG: hypothetical protein Q7R30_08535 [Acidobacteriota bacterium]|nr:hypothetical protein [Acidobacteriota bacterium]